MDMEEFAKQILYGEKLEDKLLSVNEITFKDNFEIIKSVPKTPGRNTKIKMSDQNIRFPRGHFHLDEKKALALHSFANHELLAIEMMATALLIYPHHTPELVQFKKGLISTLKDEQKHFSLYVERLNSLGYEFGDFELNEFFWKQMELLDTPEKYLSVMALTFEAANLDFAHFYKEEFLKVDDIKTADILETVLKDEISHVAFGVNYLNRWRGDVKLQEYYMNNLPGNLTPARAKGKIFYRDLRAQTKMNEDYIKWIEEYQDDFKVTKRKEWKK